MELWGKRGEKQTWKIRKWKWNRKGYLQKVKRENGKATFILKIENKSDNSDHNDDVHLDPDSDKIGLWYQEQWLVLPQLQSSGLTSSCWRGDHDNGDDEGGGEVANDYDGGDKRHQVTLGQ